MSRLSNSPFVQKGALVSIGLLSAEPTVVAFQYNPSTMTRSLTPNVAGGGGSKAETLRLSNPPNEEISLKAEFDATDGLEISDPIAVEFGISPQLAALESILYPSTSLVIPNLVLAALGTIEIIPPMAPLTLFVWGTQRVVPVQIKSISVEETAYDERLNPIQANVSLTMRVLSYADLSLTDPGMYNFLAYQAAKEALGLKGATQTTHNIF